MRTPAFLAILLFLQSCNVLALEVVEKEGMYIYFDQDEAELVARIIEPLPGMLAFLSDKGLPVEAPLHLVLDDLLDFPEVKVQMIPHKEIRIPIRAPGVLEDGYTEADPWAFLGIALSKAVFEGFWSAAMWLVCAWRGDEDPKLGGVFRARVNCGAGA